ncbi:MAG: hypothetical protein ACYCUM_04730 [Solirubrobacteraceae bacterium]
MGPRPSPQHPPAQGHRSLAATARSWTSRSFARRIDTQRSGAPATLGVIVATGYGYVRPDGIAVIPIGALRP